MAEYISREAAENLYYTVDPENDGSDGGTIILMPGTYNSAEIEAMLENLPAADVEQVRRWIPCSEGLPNDFEDVLCWYEYFRFGSFNRMFRKCGVGYQVNGHWGGEVSTGRNAKVLAWMPLPEPPEMDGGAENG